MSDLMQLLQEKLSVGSFVPLGSLMKKKLVHSVHNRKVHFTEQRR